MALEFTKSEAKEWASKNYRGLDLASMSFMTTRHPTIPAYSGCLTCS
jgi:hypothetical protein